MSKSVQTIQLLLAVCVAFIISGAHAEENFNPPPASQMIPGSVKPPPENSPMRSFSPEKDLLSFVPHGKALVTQFKDKMPKTRGLADVSLFKKVSKSVVLIITKDSLGTGSLLKDDLVLTNYHVVGKEREVTIVFKPTDPGGKPKDNEIIKGSVTKIDALRDLALVKLLSRPPYSVTSLEIASEDKIEVGLDVAAIGHPTGEAWTYTKGIVSQIRPDYEWSAGPNDIKHRATVIQTQTPINPGNSGGPLLTDDGEIVGVNSFRTKDSEGLNFAVSAKDIIAFLAEPDNPAALIQAECKEPRIIFEGRNDKNDAYLRTISTDCDDRANIAIILPDKPKGPLFTLVDLNRTGHNEGIVIDPSRTGKWTISFWDPRHDGTYPLMGNHPNHTLSPTSLSDRCPKGKIPVANLKCARR